MNSVVSGLVQTAFTALIQWFEKWWLKSFESAERCYSLVLWWSTDLFSS